MTKPLQGRTLIVAFEGWSDARDAATLAVRYLTETFDAEQVVAIESEDYFDFQFNRPIVMLDEDGDRPRAALTRLGYPDEDTLAAAIRAGDLDGRGDEVLACLREVVRHRLAIAHPGYDQVETGAP